MELSDDGSLEQEVDGEEVRGKKRTRMSIISRARSRSERIDNMLIGHDGKLREKKIDQMVWREKVAKMLIANELPSCFVENLMFKEMMLYANPDLKMISRNTVATDVMKIYHAEKEKLKSELGKVRSRICLTSDLWTTITHEGYICVTAHYIDEDWRMHSKIISFCSITSPHTGMETCRKILDCLREWGIERKIFSLTLDNGSSNDCMQDILKCQLNRQNGLVCNGEFFHVRCSAHILNLMVQDSLNVIGDTLEKIRESVEYVRGSESSMKDFRYCVDQLGGDSGSSLSMDLFTRWNSTYEMLDNALKFRYVFTCLEMMDENYKCCPSNQEWSRVEKIRNFLKPFDEIITLMSGSYYSTSNVYFVKVWKIKLLLKEYGRSEDDVIKSMAERMQLKFDKYWNEYSILLAMGVMLDPRMKLKGLKYCYDQIDKNTSEFKVDKVKRKMYFLFEEYKTNFAVSTSRSSTPSNVTLFEDLYGCDDIDSCDDGSGSALDRYLFDRKMNIKANKDMDILQYWKANTELYGVELALMASDVLCIPFTTVASESSFSIGSRVLNKYKSCLLTSDLQASLCVRSWMFGFKESGSGFGGEESADDFLATS